MTVWIVGRPRYAVELAASGREGLATLQARAGGVDLVFLDQRMGGDERA